jgi:putative CocE/NonD family hydrolase
VVAELYASSSAPDTDFTAKLVDVHPDGRAFNVVDGILRARCREGDTVQPTPIQPNTVVKFRVDMSSTSHLFKSGHRMRVEISSSNFPRFDRNPNTGERSHEAKRLETALQTILHDSRYPSHLLLPVIPR